MSTSQPELAPAPAPAPVPAPAPAPAPTLAIESAPAEVAAPPAAAPETPPQGGMSNDEKQLWANLDAVIVYFRNLGVASTVGVGALTIMKFSEKLLPGWRVVPFTVGIALLFFAFLLVVSVSMQFVRVNFNKSETWKMLLATVFALIIGLLFARAGWMTAATALNPPQPQPALQKPADIGQPATQVVSPAPAQPVAKQAPAQPAAKPASPVK